MMEDTTSNQKEMCSSATQHIADRCKVFLEIMAGPNPLTKDEIRKLIQKDERYRIFAKWAEP